MKPLQIGLLALAGALGGAIVMKVAQRPEPPAVAQVQNPAAVASEQKAAADPVESAPERPPNGPAVSAPAPEPPPASEPPATGPVPPVRREAPKPQRIPRTHKPPAHIARSQPLSRVPAPLAAPPPPPVLQSAKPEPVKTSPPPPSPVIPPARPEPEHVTPPPPPPPPEPHKVTLNTGTLIPVRLVDGLSSERNREGDAFTATLDRELAADGFVIAERGARVEGRVLSSDRGGKVQGAASLVIEITRIRLSDGQTVVLQTDPFERHAESSHREDAAKVGAGAAVGAIIGAIAGGGKGAAIGAGVGGGAGGADVLLTRGKAATLPSETRINFRLRAPVTITERQ